MKHIITRLVALGLVLFVAAETSAQRQREASGARWAHDGKHLVVGGEWYDAAGQKVEPVAEPKAEPDAVDRARAAFARTGGEEVPAAVLRGTPDRSTLPRLPIEHPGLRVSADGKTAALVVGGALWVWTEGGEARKVADGLAGVRRFEIAGNGSAVSFIDGHDLAITHTADGKTLKITDDGSDNIFNGELDWVYQEEVYGRGDFKATWWSPDSHHLAYLRIDENGVDTFTVVNHLPDQLELDTLKYPKAGRTNPRATLHVARASDGGKAAIDLGKYAPADEILIVHVGWSPRGDRVVFMVQNREQTWLDLDFADPQTGALRTVIHETCDDGWVNRPPMPLWLADGTFLWESERTGFKHLYRYGGDGELVAQVTKGEWEMRGIVRLDEAGGWVVVSGTRPEYAIGQSAYRATLDGQQQVLLTPDRGNHSVSLNADGSLVLDQFSSMENPGETWLRRADGTAVRTIASVPLPEGARPPQWHQIKARDGETLDIAFTLPADFDAEKKYPVWIDTYSGPDSPTVRDSWRGDRAESAWYVGLQVNVRSASGRGMRYTKRCYRQFGVQELADIEDAIDWLCTTHPWADAARVGITGWSYGGFMAAFALTHSKKFKCGIAGAGVYDWRLYDTIYTERYMATPQHNPDGYDASSVVKAAKDLHGELLIVHGTMDDNVHMQNAIQLIDALQKARKLNFTFMLYPNSRHGVGSPHLPALREKFMRENL